MICLALDAGGCHALHKILLQGEEHDQHRDQCHHRGRHDQAVLCGILGDEHTQTDLDGLELGLSQVDQGPRKSFQVFTKVKMVRVDRAGRLSGSMMCHQMPYSLRPSMRAASHSSVGTPS